MSLEFFFDGYQTIPAYTPDPSLAKIFSTRVTNGNWVWVHDPLGPDPLVSLEWDSTNLLTARDLFTTAQFRVPVYLSSALPTPGTEGRLGFTSDLLQFIGDNGVSWVVLGGGGGSGGIQSLGGQTGTLFPDQFFINDANVTINSSGGNHFIGWTGFLPLSRGGLGFGPPVSSGGIPYFDSTSSANFSATLNSLVLGGGVGVAPTNYAGSACPGGQGVVSIDHVGTVTCVPIGTGSVTGTGTTGRLTKWSNGPSGILSDSIVAETANTLTLSPGSASTQIITTSSAGGTAALLELLGGTSTGAAALGGSISLIAGTPGAGGEGGFVELFGHTGTPGGHVNLTAGNSTTGDGGFIGITAGDSVLNGAGGDVFVTAGAGNGAFRGGNITLTTGSGTPDGTLTGTTQFLNLGHDNVLQGGTSPDNQYAIGQFNDFSALTIGGNAYAFGDTNTFHTGSTNSILVGLTNSTTGSGGVTIVGQNNTKTGGGLSGLFGESITHSGGNSVKYSFGYLLTNTGGDSFAFGEGGTVSGVSSFFLGTGGAGATVVSGLASGFIGAAGANTGSVSGNNSLLFMVPDNASLGPGVVLSGHNSAMFWLDGPGFNLADNNAFAIKGANFQLRPVTTGAGNTAEARWYELEANGTNYVGFKAADSLAANKVWTLPTADAAGFVTSNGSAVLSLSTTFPSVAFAGLGTPANGTVLYCTDCDPTATSLPCTHAGAQTGAFAKRTAGAWNCIQ